MLGLAKIVLTQPIHTGGYFDKAQLLSNLNQVKAMLKYRLLPSCNITIPVRIDKKTAKAAMPHIFDFEDFWFVTKHYDLVTYEDLRDEFWRILPDINRVDEFLGFMNTKFDEVNYTYDTDTAVIRNKYCAGMEKLIEGGRVSANEVNEICEILSEIAEMYNEAMKKIRSAYNDFRMWVSKGKQNDSGQNPTSYRDIIRIEFEHEKERFIDEIEYEKAITETIAFFENNSHRSTTPITKTKTAKDALIRVHKAIKIQTGRYSEYDYLSDVDYNNFIKSLYTMYANKKAEDIGRTMQKKN